jgi:hypothetical protein
MLVSSLGDIFGNWILKRLSSDGSHIMCDVLDQRTIVGPT